jgi:hypothetical protein
MLRHTLCALAGLAVSMPAIANEDKKAADPAKPAVEEKAEPLPAPRPIVPELTGPYILPNLPPMVGTREVWQYYAVDRSGRFVNRVILAPYGSYYLYNGQPYPWTTTRPTLHMPYALD